MWRESYKGEVLVIRRPGGTEFGCEHVVPVLICLQPRPKSALSYACTAFIDVSKNGAHVTGGRNLAL